MSGSVPRPFPISIRTYMIVMIILMTIAPLGIIVNSTIKQLDRAAVEAFAKTSDVAKNVENHQQVLLSGAEQLAVTLSKIPAIHKRDRETTNLILSRLIASNPQYANIAVIDAAGMIWASAVPISRPVSVADKRYFRNVMATGKPSSGEYNVSNILGKPVLNFGFPLHDEATGRLDGAIVVAFSLENYGSLMERTGNKSSSILLIDHKGTILFSLNAPDIVGKTDKGCLFRRMGGGPDAGTFEAEGNSGITRLFSYRKLRFKDEAGPYMYVRAGLSKESVLAHTHRELLIHVAALTAMMLALLALAAYISKRGIFDKIIALRDGTRRFAQGDFDFRVSERVAGGELGELGASLDEMAQRLAETIAARRQAAEELAAVIQTIPDGVVVCDDGGNLLEVNDSFCALVRYGHDELIGMNIAELLAVAERNPGERLRNIIRNGRDRFETRYRRKDGETVGIEVSATYLPEHGRVYGFARDTTERELMQREVIKVQKLESVSILAGGIAHNFNNILTGVIGYISYARKHLDDPQKTKESLDSAERAGFRAAALARQLLTFSRGGDPLRTPIAVDKLLMESVSLFLAGTNVRTVIDCPAGFVVNADREQMDQAFNNIILNARQAMPRGGTLTVTVAGVTVTNSPHPLPSGEYLQIVFADTGCGIDDDDLLKVFDLYFTTKDTGTGLGLSTTQSIVKKHGGTIDIASRVGEGTTVTVLLPASAEEPADEAVACKAAPEETPGQSILVMDDQELIRELTTKMLVGNGYDVDTCADGEEAVALYRGAREEGRGYAVVIMDLTVPGGVGGTEAARRILEFDPAARLVVSSGYSDDPVMADPGEFGFCGALMKPYTVEALIETLDLITR